MGSDGWGLGHREGQEEWGLAPNQGCSEQDATSATQQRGRDAKGKGSWEMGKSLGSRVEGPGGGQQVRSRPVFKVFPEGCRALCWGGTTPGA